MGVTGSIPFRGGIAALTVAGTVSGWDLAYRFAHQKLGGGLPLSRLLADAVHYADHGIAVTRSQHANTLAKRAELEAVHGFAQTFLPGGNVPAEGQLFRQPRLAATLRRLASRGLDDFYRGELAESIAADLARAGSPLQLADLRGHHARWREPLTIAHSAGSLYNMPPPTQGLVSLMILGILDRLDIGSLNPMGANYVHLAVEAVKQSFRIRDKYITDPAFMTVDPKELLAPARLDELAAGINLAQAAPWGAGKPGGDTIWMGVIDGAGTAVSFIQSLYHEFGSGVVLQDSGINWQNRGCSFSLDPRALNPLTPGRKPFHTLNPALARLSDGRVMVYGNMGGDGQPQTQSAVFTRCIVHGRSPAEAIALPRWLLGRTWGQASDTLKLESRFAPSIVAELRRRGHEIEEVAEYDEIMGHAGAIIRRPDGIFEGAADPRSDGAVAGW